MQNFAPNPKKQRQSIMKRIIQLTLVLIFAQFGNAQLLRDELFDTVASRLRVAEKEKDRYIGKPFSEFLKHLEKHGLEVVIASAIKKVDTLILTDRRVEGVFLQFTRRFDSPLMPAMWVYFSNSLPYPEALNLFRKYGGFFTEATRAFYADALIQQIDIWAPETTYDVICGGWGDPDIEPRFPDNEMAALPRFLQENIRYPRNAFRRGIEEEIVVEFAIDKDGSVVDIEVVQGTNPDLKNEAIRIISSMPRWVPGRENFEPIRIKYSLQIFFRTEYFTSYFTVRGRGHRLRFRQPNHAFGELTRLTPHPDLLERFDSERRAVLERIRDRESGE